MAVTGSTSIGAESLRTYHAELTGIRPDNDALCQCKRRARRNASRR